MKLISDFRDYYDGLVKANTNSEAIFIRNRELKIVKPLDSNYKQYSEVLDYLTNEHPPVQVSNYIYNKIPSCVVGVNGVLYPCFIPDEEYEYRKLETSPIESWITPAHKLVDELKSMENFEFSRRFQLKYRAFFAPASKYYTNLEETLATRKEKRISYLPFQDLDTPIFVAWRHYESYIDRIAKKSSIIIIKNPILSQLNFVTVLDPYQISQEVEQYFNSVRSVEDKAPLTVGGDDVLAKAKGFDEYSFKNIAPGQKKLNRKANKDRKRSENN